MLNDKGKGQINEQIFKKLYGGGGLLKSDIGIMKSKGKLYKYTNNYRKLIGKPLFDIDNIGVVSKKNKEFIRRYYDI